MSNAETLHLEPLRPGHAAELFDGLSDPAGYRFLAEDPPTTPRALAQRHARQIVGGSSDGAELWLNWVVRQQPGGQAVGYTQATIRDRSALLGYHILPAYWNRGVGTSAVRLTTEHLFSGSDVGDVWALVDTRNHASIALLRRLGFALRCTVIAADHFKGARSDEHEFSICHDRWRALRG